MPTATPHRCLWRMPKMVTSFLTNWMIVEDGAVRVCGGHMPAREMGESGNAQASTQALGVAFVDIPEHVASMTDPWTWYARWHRHALAGNRGHGGDVLRFYAGWGPDEPRTAPPFRDVLYGITHLSERQPPIARPLGITPTTPNHPGPNGPGGLYTWLVDYMFRDAEGRWLIDVVWDASRVYEVLEAVYGCSVDRKVHYVRNSAQMRDHRKLGPGLTDYRDWYDDEMLGWVADADGEMIDLFGFRPFEFPDWLTHNISPPGRGLRACLVTRRPKGVSQVGMLQAVRGTHNTAKAA